MHYMSEHASGYENIYHDLAQALGKIDLPKRAAAMGFAFSPGQRIEVMFLGRCYLVDNEGIKAKDGNNAEWAYLSIIAKYFLQQGYGEPALSFVTLSKLAQSILGKSNYERSALERPLIRRFNGRPHVLAQAAAQLGAIAADNIGRNGRSWIFYVLPKVPVRLIYHEGDHDFADEFRIMFDLTALNFLQYEYLNVLSSIFVQEMVKAADQNPWP